MSSYDVSLFDMRQRCSNPPQVVLGLPSFALLNDIETGEIHYKSHTFYLSTSLQEYRS